ncbi:protein FAM177A1 isoform X2 [Anabas testudineus]|uniref:Family with sequence similarity 177 member B n=2 Tax=Anabas testudineus TaxID=64144 RepID=A0A7N6A6W2_ANATE|nr:protein FAM177A1 isoform X2 [Anabas testudineus]XP_026196560.1 protein FAM177A1 isoform X2 [Anabas testudineus]
MDIQETQFEDPAPSKKRIIHFSSGDTLELEDSEEEEERSSSAPPFTEPTETTRFSFKSLAVLVGRVSLLTCDFLGERLAGALGLNAAKYQYAIDQYHHDRKRKSDHATDVQKEGQAEATQLSCGQTGTHYGATSDARCLADPQEHTGEGYCNKGYQAEEDCLK